MRSMPGMISGRQNYWDYAFTNVSQNFGVDNQGPHAFTTRWTYNVPAGKRAICVHAICHVLRQAAATVAGEYGGRVTYIPNGGFQVLLSIVTKDDIVLGSGDVKISDPFIWMLPGDSIQGATIDLSTNGNVEYHVAAVIYEITP